MLISYRVGRLGDIYPIGQSVGQVNVAGRNWDLWVGYNGAMKVYSYIAPSPVNNFSADVKQFFNDMKNRGYPADSQYLLST